MDNGKTTDIDILDVISKVSDRTQIKKKQSFIEKAESQMSVTESQSGLAGPD